MPILNEVRSHPPAAETPVPVSKVSPAATTAAAPRELNADSSSIEVFAVQVLKVVARYDSNVFCSSTFTTSSASRRSSNSANPNPS